MDKRHKAKKEAIKKLKSLFQNLAGQSSFDHPEEAITAKVIAKDPEDLKEGLKKAAEIVEEKEEMFDDPDYYRKKLLKKIKESR